MKLKYYLRGLGTGMVVTALILGISGSFSDKGTMTDEEIRARAKELGLVERTTLSEAVMQAEENEDIILPEESKTEILSEEPESTEEASEENLESEQETDKQEADEQANDKQETGEQEAVREEEASPEENAPFGMPAEAGTVSLQIIRGDSSVSVSKRMEELGLIDDASAYDRYLCQNGYDKKIRTGTYEIPVNATQEEIARMITGN